MNFQTFEHEKVELFKSMTKICGQNKLLQTIWTQGASTLSVGKRIG